MLHVDYITAAEITAELDEMVEDRLWSKACRIGRSEFYSDLHLNTSRFVLEEKRYYSEQDWLLYGDLVEADCEARAEELMPDLDWYVQVAYEQLAA